MLFHYLAYQTMQEADCASLWVRSAVASFLYDRVQGASASAGDLYLGGKYWYVFHTREPLTPNEKTSLLRVASTCGHALNVLNMYW